jgi:ribonuclease P protein component
MPAQFTLGKHERLKRRKIIDQLFSDGKAINLAPLRAIYKLYQNKLESPLQAGFTVGSRHFKKAVDRNRIKRLLREAWRLQKNSLQEKLSAEQKQLAVFIIYTGKEMPPSSKVHEGVAVILNKLEKRLNENSTADT